MNRLTRAERQERRLFGVLRCEWCNRFTQTGRYKEVMTGPRGELLPPLERQKVRRELVFSCRRNRCKRTRPNR